MSKIYYKNVSSDNLLSAKEILKSMPRFYHKIYFSASLIDAMSGETNTYENVYIFAKEKDMDFLRNEIKKNYLYHEGLDSKSFKDTDYGFSFAIGYMKYVLGVIYSDEDYTYIKLFDSKNKEGITKKYENNFNLVYSFKNENNDKIRICDINNGLVIDDKKEKLYEEPLELSNPTLLQSYGFSSIKMIVSIITIIAALIIIIIYKSFFT